MQFTGGAGLMLLQSRWPFWLMFNTRKMMFKLKTMYSVVAIAAAVAVFVPAAQAKVFSIPAEDAIATINAPEDWEPSETDKGVEMNSPDRGIYIDVEAVKADDISGAVAETVKLLASQGLVLDQSSQKTSDSERDGLKMHDFLYDGTDKDGPTNFAITLVETSDPTAYLMLTFWGSDEALKANGKTLGEITKSVQLTKH
jgi:hypothetical protein